MSERATTIDSGHTAWLLISMALGKLHRSGRLNRLVCEAFFMSFSY